MALTSDKPPPTRRRGSLDRPLVDCGEHTADPTSDYWYRQEQADLYDPTGDDQ